MTIVAFFTAGSMLQLVFSILISVLALLYHVYARPYRESWLNVLQGVCLFMIWLTRTYIQTLGMSRMVCV